MTTPIRTISLRDRILGLDEQVPLLDGRRVPYVNLDNTASTPPLQDVMDELSRFMPFYSSVHRGTGFKSRLSTEVYERAHATIAEFVGADLSTNCVIFGKNATEAINKLSYRIPIADDAVVITTMMVTIRTICHGENGQRWSMWQSLPKAGWTRMTSTGSSTNTLGGSPWLPLAEPRM